MLGDTVRFVSLAPPQLVITGRTRHFVNAFGENVIVEEVERAAAEACARTGAQLVEFTVAPVYPHGPVQRARHEWAVEFRTRPSSLAAFAGALDEALQRLNTDYRTKRAGDVGMAAPRVTPVPPAGFHRWLEGRGQLGDQHKVPRASNQRDVREAVGHPGAERPPGSQLIARSLEALRRRPLGEGWTPVATTIFAFAYAVSEAVASLERRLEHSAGARYACPAPGAAGRPPPSGTPGRCGCGRRPVVIEM